MNQTAALKATWRIPGICTERRELTTKKDGTVWKRTIRLTGLGGVYELSVPRISMYEQAEEGGFYVATGHFEQGQNRMELVLETLATESGEELS